MGGIPQHRDPALAPAREADRLELRPARLLPVRLGGDAGEKGGERRKRPRPGFGVDRRRLARLVVDQRAKQDIKLPVIDRAVQHPAVVRPGLDHHSAGDRVLGDLPGRAWDGDPDPAVALPDALPEQAERLAQRGPRPVGQHDEIGLEPGAAVDGDDPVGGNLRHQRVQPDLRPRLGGAAGEQAHDVAPVDAVGAALGLPGQHHVAVPVERVAPVDPRAAADHRLGDAERFEDQHHVGLNGDAVAFGVDRAAAFVQPHRPAALGERRRRDEPAEPAADDLCVAGLQADRLGRSRSRRRPPPPRRRCLRHPG